jgi:TolB protein
MQGLRSMIIAVFVAATALAVIALATSTPSSATFSGTNGRITFARFVPNPDPDKFGGIEIFSAKPDGSDVTRLTFSGFDADGNSHTSFFSDWSPSGQKIAFDSDRTGDVQIWTMNWDGSDQTQLTTGAGFHSDPGYTPSGAQLAIGTDWGDGPGSEIWLIPSSDPDGVTKDEATQVTTIPAGMEFDDSEPQVSPDGQSIVFTRFTGCKEREHGKLAGSFNGCISAIFVVGIDGNGLRRLTPWGLSVSAPDWSPSGQKIAFDSCDSSQLGCKGDIYVMNSDGTGRTRIVDSPPIGDVGHDFANFRFDYRGNPVWSPDGTKIMYTHWLDGGFPTELVTVNPDGSGESTVVGGDFSQNKADWGTHP